MPNPTFNQVTDADKRYAFVFVEVIARLHYPIVDSVIVADLREHRALQHVQPPGLGHRFPILQSEPFRGHGLEDGYIFLAALDAVQLAMVGQVDARLDQRARLRAFLARFGADEAPAVAPGIRWFRR